MKPLDKKELIAQLASVPKLPDGIYDSVMRSTYALALRRRISVAAAAVIFCAAGMGVFSIHSQLHSSEIQTAEYHAVGDRLSSAGSLFSEDESDDEEFMTIAYDSYNQ